MGDGLKRAKKAAKATRKKKPPEVVDCKSISCLLIQWNREKPPVDADGNLICPECKQPAEMILGVFGQPCYAHK